EPRAASFLACLVLLRAVAAQCHVARSLGRAVPQELDREHPQGLVGRADPVDDPVLLFNGEHRLRAAAVSAGSSRRQPEVLLVHDVVDGIDAPWTLALDVDQLDDAGFGATAGLE